MALVNYTNEFGPLKTVALYRPRLEEIFQGDPEEVMYVSRPDPTKVLEEFDRIVDKFQELGVRVEVLHDEDGNLPICPNMIYLRDVASVVGKSIIPANMKHSVRQLEPKKFLTLLEKQSPQYMEYVDMLLDHETMEGADIFVLSENEICAYTGYRTSRNAVKKIAEKLSLRVHDIPANIQRIPQHLLGGMHIIAPDLLLRRPEYCKEDIDGYKAIDFDETNEIIKDFGMNIVTIAQSEVLMPEHCLGVRRALEGRGITCHMVKIDEIHKMGGGLACMTLPLKRSIV